jgi:hypothetical protein
MWPNHSLQATATRLRRGAWVPRTRVRLSCGGRRLVRVAVPEFDRSALNMKTLMITVVCLLLGFRAFASEEEFAIWSSVEITSNIERAGLVRVSGDAKDGRITSLLIVAFGRTNTVSGEHLKKISLYPLSDMKITHGAGYERLGGYSVHVRLRRITYDSDKKLHDETAIITVTEMSGLQPVTIREAK